MVKEIFEDQSADDKTKFAERYNDLFEFMESSEASDEKKKNFNEWNQKMNEFFKILCDEDYSKKDELKACLDELKTLTDNITRIIFLKQFYTDLFDDLYYAFDNKIREDVGRGMGDDDDYSDSDFDDDFDDDSDSDSDSDY
jgi:seryl-tRNA synthetase